MSELNTNQLKAAQFEGKHLLVLAGAGTGKTRTIIARAVYLISKGVDPSKIQILTFTKRAASEIVSRVKASMGEQSGKNPTGSTFHSWCNQLLYNFPNVFGTAKFTIIDEDDQVSIMKMVCGNQKEAFKKLRLKPRKLVDLYSFARNTKRNLTDTLTVKLFDDVPENELEERLAEVKPLVESILRKYEMKKRERKYLDYDDMIQVVANRLNKDPKARQIIGKKYEHLLIDEMQDTNPLQWELIRPFQQICHLFCVGDDAQSIYAFRGADFKNIHNFKKNVKDAEVFRLEENYRSTSEILDVSNWLLDKSTLNYEKRLSAVRGSGIKPKIINVPNEWEEGYFIAAKIIENFTEKDKEYNDHLILSRSQNYTRSLQAIFIEKKIPFETYGGRSFMEAAHLKDVFSAFRVVNNNLDEIAWVRFLTFWEGIGEISAAKYIQELINKEDIEECIQWLEEGSKGPFEMIETLKGIASNMDKIDKAVEAAYGTMQARLAMKYVQDWDKKRKPDFPILTLLARNYSNLSEFITECLLDNSTKINNSPTLKKSEIQENKEEDAVIISTVHSAKGLEASTCFVLNVSPKVYPSAWSLGDIEKVEEDRRVLYVALTRAKDELFITRRTSSIYAEDHVTEDGSAVPTYFLNEFPEELTDQVFYSQEKGESVDAPIANDFDFDFGMDFS
ncbi:ATP-dependent helicase [Portibacter lacus]|uniref:DNA 3'-5' helicase n=1 Tax=Portibacter lacus TaxID=1099794 RepID=A0AA37SNP4_9BACT|nr:ATP-dependent helicase [Portibacter lacus]GLR18001.1 DNA helicase [Portibacter lacus]